MPQYCTSGDKLHTEFQQRNQAISALRQKMSAVQQQPDSLARRVPRSMHESLKGEVDQRAMNRMRWDIHLQKCWTCAAVESDRAVEADGERAA